jgi:hypothetical protein
MGDRPSGRPAQAQRLFQEFRRDDIPHSMFGDAGEVGVDHLGQAVVGAVPQFGVDRPRRDRHMRDLVDNLVRR